MILNLIYEFPHPGNKYIVQSSFWKSKRKSVYQYETLHSLPYCDDKYFLELWKFQDKLMKIWHLLSRVLFGKSIILISQSQYKLIAWSEILKSLIFPFQYPGLIIS